MLGSITPLGERGRNSRWGVTMTAFVIGGIAGGAMLGAALGWLGTLAGSPSWPVPARSLTLAALVLLGALADAGAFGLRLPTVHRQVDERWLHRYRGWVYGLGFGYQLGLGVVTIVVVSAVYATFAAALLSGSAAAGALVGGAFGLVRSSTAFRASAVRRPEQLAALDERIEALATPGRRVALAAEVVLSAAAVALALGAVA